MKEVDVHQTTTQTPNYGIKKNVSLILPLFLLIL
jgi:hypothetical protein